MKPKQIRACGGVVLTGMLMCFCCGGGIWILSRSNGPAPKPVWPEASFDVQQSRLKQLKDLQQGNILGGMSRASSHGLHSDDGAWVEVRPGFQALSPAEMEKDIAIAHYYLFAMPPDEALGERDGRFTEVFLEGSGQDALPIGYFDGESGGLWLGDPGSVSKEERRKQAIPHHVAPAKPTP